MPFSERCPALLLLAVLSGGILLAIARPLPRALGRDAPREVFSAGRASAVLERVAREPHPVGSPEHERVRELLLAELDALGLEVEQQRGIEGGVALTNLIARLPGSASTGTVLCLAHYDSRRTTPGAGDDGAGVSAWIEAFRVLRARRTEPRNDLLLVLTDGEELGLLGARLFAREHARAPDVKLVVNLEAIGNGGPAVLFELGPENGARVREFARAVRHPMGTSLSDAVYQRMPNDTDLSVFLARGVRGFNLALTQGSSAYHAPHDTPANLDPRSLQHMGETALALAERLGELDLSAGLDGPDVTFFDVAGTAVVAYPRALDALLVVAGVALALRHVVRAWKSGERLFAGLAAHVALALLPPAVIAATLWALERSSSPFTPELGWTAGNTTSGALLFAGLACVLAALELRRARGDETRLVRRASAALIVWSLLALLALFFLPGASFVFGLPLLAAGIGAGAGRGAGAPSRSAAQIVGLAATLLVTLPILHTLLQLFLRSPTFALLLFGGFLASGTLLFAPHFHALRRGAPWAGVPLFALGSLALLGSFVVAHVLVWRQGALWP